MTEGGAKRSGQVGRDQTENKEGVSSRQAERKKRSR